MYLLDESLCVCISPIRRVVENLSMSYLYDEWMHQELLSIWKENYTQNTRETVKIFPGIKKIVV